MQKISLNEFSDKLSELNNLRFNYLSLIRKSVRDNNIIEEKLYLILLNNIEKELKLIIKTRFRMTSLSFFHFLKK
jgi:hypothetical protein